MPDQWDVIVVGAGPGGALAAKRCAESGLNTLLVEKKSLPREKVCSGMVMGQWAQSIMREAFGEIPDDVLVEPRYLSGYAAHVPGAPVRMLDIRTPITWRKRLDYWMIQKAIEAGVEVWDEARAIGLMEKGRGLALELILRGHNILVETTFVIGADGARSLVREVLFPELKPTYWHCYRECYDVQLNLPEKRFNFFSTVETAPFYFCTHDKDGFMLMEGGAALGTIKQTASKSRQFLIDHHGLDPSRDPLWRDGCVEPILYRELFTKTFRPARGNTLLIGDAAGLNIPVSGEGIGTSMRSGRDAANAVVSAAQGGQAAETLYLEAIEEYIERFQDVYAFSKKIKEAAAKSDPEALSEALLQSWDYALRLFEG